MSVKPTSYLQAAINIYPTSGTFTMGAYPDNQAFDARSYVTKSYPTTIYPVRLGETSAGRNPCWEGGVFLGQQSRSLTWDDVKAIGGGAMTFKEAGGADINAYQADNMEDGINLRAKLRTDPTSGDGWTIRNTYIIYNRDDCIENDDGTSGTVYDVLWDGCYVGISAAIDHTDVPDQSNETIVIDHALIHMTQMPSTRHTNGLDGGWLLKWRGFAPRPVIRDSIILVEKPNDVGEWPPGTILENVTIVLENPGTLSLDPLPGMTVTSDISVWNNAKADWLTRHGCGAFVPGVGALCTRQANPTPPA